MNILYVIIIILQVGVIVYFVRRSRRQNKQPTGAEIYEHIRNKALSITPFDLKIAIPNSDTLVYGVIMDMDIGETMATLAAYITGAANLYFSSGGGKVGAGKSPSVGEAAVEFVVTAQQYLDKGLPVTETGTPGKGFVRFYFLTNQRTYMVQEEMANFERDASELMLLFAKGNEVITEIRSSGNGVV